MNIDIKKVGIILANTFKNAAPLLLLILVEETMKEIHPDHEKSEEIKMDGQE